jgi:hypothetical protein
MADRHPRASHRLILGFLLFAHIIICCASLIFVADYEFHLAVAPTVFHLFYDPSRWYVAVAAVTVFALFLPLFVLADFSFGYFVGFYFYTMVLSYLWLNCFTDTEYDHRRAGFFAAASAVAFLLPVLFTVSPIRQRFILSTWAFDRLLTSILLLAVVTIAVGASYNFRFVAIENIYNIRNNLESPKILNYLIGTTSSALLPFCFAGFLARGARWQAGAVLLLLLFLYPITLTKTALFTPFWLVFILLTSKLFEARIAIVVSLLVPILAGIVLSGLFGGHAARYFSTVNFRLVAIPALAMDVYNDFFARHDFTYFCQISVLKPIMHCPYQDQLSVVMQKAYGLGYFNASLFATEGIASVGTAFSPIAVFFCGLVIALGNRLSAGLPAGFVLVSGAILPPLLLNVPLTTVLLTHGTGLLFLLWYITPRTIFEPSNSRQITPSTEPCNVARDVLQIC